MKVAITIKHEYLADGAKQPKETEFKAVQTNNESVLFEYAKSIDEIAAIAQCFNEKEYSRIFIDKDNKSILIPCDLFTSKILK